jgi:maleylpyruvate isomerase
MPDLDDSIAGCAQAHRRLRETLGQLDDELARRPSRLPDWSVGHVLTHVARNADSHVRILDGALTGEHLEQYEGGPQQRAADIEAGAGRSAGELVDDVITTFVRLEDAFERMTPEAWGGWGLSRGQRWPCRDLPFFRWREVEVHHVDLGLGYDVVDWPDDYVAAELPVALSALPLRITDPFARATVLGWLLGRNQQPAAVDLQPWQARVENYLVPPGGSAA